VLRGYYSALEALAASGNSLVIDDVLFMDNGPFRDEMVSVRQRLPRRWTWWKPGNARGNRVMGQARGHYCQCHESVHYDAVMDTLSTPAELARQVLALVRAGRAALVQQQLQACAAAAATLDPPPTAKDAAMQYLQATPAPRVVQLPPGWR
jgi:hypothetical protein